MKTAIKYSIIVCMVSWVYAAIMIFGVGAGDVAAEPMRYTIFATSYMLLPMISAIVLKCRDAKCCVSDVSDAKCCVSDVSDAKYCVSDVSDAKYCVSDVSDAKCCVSDVSDAKYCVSTRQLLRFKIKGSWFVAWFLPVVIVLLTMVVNTLFLGVEFNRDLSSMIPLDQVPEEQKALVSMMMNPALLIIITVASGLFAGVTINALFAFGEEYGWRNYMVSALREKKFVFASIFTGIVWGLWHFPLILLGHNYPQHSVAGVFMMVVLCVLLSFIELYLVLKAKSVYPAAIFHGTINAIAGLNVLLIKGGNDLLNGANGLSGFIVLTIIIVVIYLFDKYVCKDNIFTKTIGEVLDNGER